MTKPTSHQRPVTLAQDGVSTANLRELLTKGSHPQIWLLDWVDRLVFQQRRNPLRLPPKAIPPIKSEAALTCR